MSIDTRLATYGSLAPGRPNHDQLSSLSGNWQKASVRGHLVEEGWGAAMGFPAIMLDPLGQYVDVDLFTSQDLPKHWHRLDTFEGNGYRRTRVELATGSGMTDAWIYVSASM